MYNKKYRQVRLTHSFVRKLIKDVILLFTYIRSNYNLVDPFTKPLIIDLIKTTSRGMRLKLLE